MSSTAFYEPCRQIDDNNIYDSSSGQHVPQQQNLISPSSTIPEQLECHIPSLPSPVMYHRCATRSRIAAAVICVVLLTFVIFTITAARAKSNSNSINTNTHQNGLKAAQQELFGEQQALGLSQESVVVDTVCGKLIGDEEHDAFVFKGIPYATPPVGHRRWLPPLAVHNDSSHCKLNGQRHATKFGSECYQVNPFTKQFEGSEDCLYLNIWTPIIDPEANLSVMVWIHGGFLQFGSGHQPGLRPSGKLAKSMNTVYVSLNYRLHAFGFLGLDLLINNNETSDDYDDNNNMNSTNFGIMDVIVALEWIQLNINTFGGSANKVTLFGADSGASIILAIMSNPDLKSLYHSSWLLDAAVYFNHTIGETSRHIRKNFLRHTGCENNLQCLRSLSAKQVVEHFLGKNDPSFRINDQNDLPILGILSEQLITVDDVIVRDSYPYANIKTSSSILIGSTAQSIEFWPGPRDLSLWQWRDYSKYVTTSLDSFGSHVSKKALQLYPPIDDGNETTPAIQYINMVSDLRQICPVNFLAQNLAQNSLNNSSIFRYIFKAKLSKPVRVYDYDSWNAFHLIDAIAYFDQIDTYLKRATERDKSIRDTIQQIVHTFINNNHYNNSLDINNNSENSNATSLSATHPIVLRSFPQQFIEIMSSESESQSQSFTDQSIVGHNYTQTDRCLFWSAEQLFNYVWTV